MSLHLEKSADRCRAELRHLAPTGTPQVLFAPYRICPIGAHIDQAQPFGVAGSFFGEDQGLYIVTVPDEALTEFLTAAAAADVPADPMGRTIRDRIIFELDEGDWSVPIADLRTAHEGFFPALMGS